MAMPRIAELDHGSLALPASAEELQELFAALGSATDALRRSHVDLGNRVKHLEREIRRKDRALERKRRLEALGKIAAGVAHEIRNPLGSLSLYLDLLEQETAGGARASELIGRMRMGVSLLSTTVNDILTFTEPGAASPAPCDIVTLLEDAILFARSDVADGVQFVRSFPVERRQALADADWVRRIFLNLVRNALQAMPDGGVLYVSVRYGKAVVARLRDTGPGMPAEDLEKACIPFWSRREGGTGLGLAIAHSLAERHQGRLELANHPLGGLEAKVVLPWQLESEEG